MDIETGMFMYTWALGTAPCRSDVLPWLDPFSNQRDSSTWSYAAALSGFAPLADGRYYVSVRGFNNVQRGGPLATTVCNSVPIAVDTTQPVQNSFLVSFSDEEMLLKADFNFT